MPDVVRERRGLPPLENGDLLTRAEFHRRYVHDAGVKKAQLIEGVVYMPSPVGVTHGSSHVDLATWLGTYRAYTPGVMAIDNTTVILDPDNEPQPDLAMRIERGGTSSVDDKGYVVGAPELAIEIAGSSASIDLRDKLNAYRRTGVKEYIVWRTYDEAIDVFVHTGEDLQRIELPNDGIYKGIYRSIAFPGLWLNVQALLKRDLAGVLTTLNAGIADESHAAFVKSLG